MKKGLIVISLLFSPVLMCCGKKAPPHEHLFDKQNTDEKFLASDATCISSAKYYYSCDCGEHGEETFSYGNPLGHSFTDYKTDNNATCTHNGTKTAKCDRCDETRTITDHDSKLPHTFNVTNTDEQYLCSEGDCEHKATYFYSCECGACGSETFEYGEIKGHTYGSPSLYEIDKVKYTCDDCGHSKVEDRYKKLDVYATNDYHGAVNGSTPALAFASYFREKSDLPNTLLIDSGDTWKGPYESNINYGAYVTDLMNYARFDARAVGNHDFDWGLDVIRANTAASYDGYSTPVLAPNCFDYDFETGTYGNQQQSDIGREYVTYTLENGLKVGIVGIIPDDQIQTTCSNLVREIGFKDYKNIAKNVAKKLRIDEKCDIVIGSIHDGVMEFKRNLSDLTTVCSQTGKPYVDLMLCSHTHAFETELINGILCIQNSASGSNFRLVNMEYDSYENKVVECDDITLYSSTIVNNYTPHDEVQKIIDKYTPAINEKKNLVVHNNVTSSFDKTDCTNLLSKGIYEMVNSGGYGVDYSFVYEAYTNLNAGTWKYPDLFSTYKFDNIIYVADVKGSEMLNVFNYTPESDIVKLAMYRGESAKAKAAIDPNQTYRIAIQDKLLFHVIFHTDGRRTYDFFPTHQVIDYIKLNGKTFFYRDMMVSYLKSVANMPLDKANYSGSHYDSTLLTQAI